MRNTKGTTALHPSWYLCVHVRGTKPSRAVPAGWLPQSIGAKGDWRRARQVVCLHRKKKKKLGNVGSLLRGCPTVTQHSLNTAAAATRATQTADNTIINSAGRLTVGEKAARRSWGRRKVCAPPLRMATTNRAVFMLLRAACTPAPDAPLEKIRAQLVHKTWTDFSKSYNMAGNASWLGCKSLPAVRTRPLSHRSSSSSSHALHPSLYRSYLQ